MSYLPLVMLLYIWFAISIRISFSSTPNPLNGQHLRVIWTLWSGNPKGLIGPLKGAVLLECMSKRFNFTYEMVRVTDATLGPLANGKGLFNYLLDQRCEFLVHNIYPTLRTNAVVDLTLPWAYDDYAFAIPIPVETANINAVVKPFQWQIWLGLGKSIVCVIAILNLIQRYLEYRSSLETSNVRPNDNNNPPTEKIITKGRTAKQFLYVFGNLLSQGGPCPSKRLPYRLVAGVWILAAFFFVQAYTSTLFTYVVTPINQPLINSIYDLINSNDINLYVRESSLINTLIYTANETGLYKTLRKRLDSLPNSRCTLPSECIQSVRPGLRNVFAESTNYLNDEIRKHYIKTGKCIGQMAKEKFFGITVAMGLPKNSPYTQTITQVILELQENGLINYWDTWFRPMPPQCNGKPQIRSKKTKLSPLSLKNLTGAFLVLLIGLGLSILAFLVEKIISVHERLR
ncbi:glutamate receptor ionotropic, kainate 2-like [Daphnia pulex]|uniref:glutamate receptor ionotropic, kainate 2-like n=1 Tax=Daphnia pulex TaxID=6669 RepID=UPI001EE049CB|nr:glutamate receptor ionotropic, kainate 2-like [Daphnia pulex]